MKWKFNLGSKPEWHAVLNRGFYHQVGHKPPSGSGILYENLRGEVLWFFLKTQIFAEGEDKSPLWIRACHQDTPTSVFKVDLSVQLGKTNKPVIIYFRKILETFWLSFNSFQFQKCVSTHPHLTTFTKNYNSSFYYFNC